MYGRDNKKKRGIQKNNNMDIKKRGIHEYSVGDNTSSGIQDENSCNITGMENRVERGYGYINDDDNMHGCCICITIW